MRNIFSSLARLNRRDLFRRGGLLAWPVFLGRRPAAAAPVTAGLQVGSDIYRSIGIRPLINCRGTLTIVGGSLELPEVRAAKEAAARHYVHLDEMMDGIGKRLAELTGAEWGIVTSGCAAAIAHATAACVAGANPDLHVRIPNLAGFAKDEVVIPRQFRTVYDAAVRSIGVRVVEIETAAELEAALGSPRVAMIYYYAGRITTGPLLLESVTAMARKRSVPVFVDAAAEDLTIPNIHLQNGASLVGYSGGKSLRGPQCAGLLLGRKDLVQAAWMNSAPHHGYGRAMKVGKEEAIGMLMAVEMWARRDHDAEWKGWVSRLDKISKRVTAIPGVTADVREPRGLSNHSPGLTIRWDPVRSGISGEEVAEILYNTEPRIALGGSGGVAARGAQSGLTSISVSASMMADGDEAVVADRVYAVLSQQRPPKPPREHKPPSADLGGIWDVHLDFIAGSTEHTLSIRQEGNRLAGVHQGDFVGRDISGTIDGDVVRIYSNIPENSTGDHLEFTFTGKVTGDTMSGDLDTAEYFKGRWTARRHTPRPGLTAR
jgi:L-seryl-tRNA(Ser) seleniumtransferase